ARALAEMTGTDAQVAARRAQAVQMLREADRKGTKSPEFAHQIAEIQRLQDLRAEAVATLKAGLQTDSSDDHGLALLAKYLPEPATGAATARAVFEQAVAQYDLVRKAQANSVEAVNNKAWILHRYLGRHAEALDLAEDLVRRADPTTLPAEFLDTLGSIQEAM